MHGIKEFNFPAFFDAEKILILRGFDVINPASFEPTTDGKFDIRKAFTWDCTQICTCDAIYMLTGWEYSSGARAEHALATTLKLTFIYGD